MMKQTKTNSAPVPPVVDFPGDHRIHVGLAVSDLDRSESFYRALLDTEPVKRRPGYLKFEPEDPSVNLSLNLKAEPITPPEPPVHYGIQVKTPEGFSRALQRIRQSGIPARVEKETRCCYAEQDKFWVIDPDGTAWEVFLVLDSNVDQRKSEHSACCA